LGQQSTVFVHFAVFLVAPSTVRVGRGLLRDLIETVVDGLSLRQMRQKAPGHYLAGIGPRIVEAFVFGDGTIVPLEGAAGVSI
jgi:hypothetical protein